MADSYLVGKSFPYEGKTLTVGSHVDGSKSHQCTDENEVIYTFSSRFLGTLFPKPVGVRGRTKRTDAQVIMDDIKSYSESIEDVTVRSAALRDLSKYVDGLNT